MRLIDADALVECLSDKMQNDLKPDEIEERFYNCGLETAIIAAKNTSTVDAEPVRHGRWEGFIHSAYCGMDEDWNPIYRDKTVWYCSNRKCRRKTVVRERYCPNCGAKMDLEEPK